MAKQNITKTLRVLRRQMREEEDPQLEKYHLFLDYYTKEVSDSAMPYVFAEFQRTTKRRVVDAEAIQHGTLNQKRKYLANCIRPQETAYNY